MNRRALCLLLLPLVLACGPYFFSAPPPLHKYPERTASKPWRQLLDEAHAPSEDSKAELTAMVSRWVEPAFGQLPDERLRQIEKFQQRNRSGEFSIKLANLLIEMKELMAKPAEQEVLVAYFKKRLEEVGGTQLDFQPPRHHWMLSDEQYEAKLKAHNDQMKRMEKGRLDVARNGPELLEPNHRVRLAAFYFRSWQYQKALREFNEVVRRFENHPRAEVAMFMRGRCLLGMARKQAALSDEEADPDAQFDHMLQLETARDAFDQYLATYPEGRFVDDVHGWIGAILHDKGNLSGAINRQLLRAEIQPTREVMHSVMRELDGILPRLHDIDDYHLYQIDYARLAKRPALVRQWVYHCLDYRTQGQIREWEEGYDGGRDVLRQAKAIRLRGEESSEIMLHELARAVIQSRKPVDQVSAWVLGWSLLRQGKPAQALAILDGQKDDHVELLQLKAKACHQLGRFQQSREALATLIALNPEGPLAPAARFDHALATYRVGRAGEAMLEMLDLVRGKGSEEGISDPAYQWADTLAQFGSLREMRDALENLPADHPEADTLRVVVRNRFLCRGAFETARRYLDPPASDQGEELSHLPDVYDSMHLDQQRWDREVAPLATTLKNLETATGARKATLHLKAAEQWAALRGRVVMPLHLLLDYSASEHEKSDDLRRVNGRILGHSDDFLTAELDQRDELYHALQHWKAVLEIEDVTPEMTRAALFQANEALFKLAEFSPYRLSRAVENGHTTWSRQWVERLQREFPKSAEAKSAIAYHFEPPVLLGHWMPGNRAPWILSEKVDDALSEVPEEKAREARQQFQLLQEQFEALAESKDPVADTQKLLDRFNQLRPFLDRSDVISMVDDLDDLHAAARLEAVTPALFATYYKRRMERNSLPIKGGESFKPFLDYLYALSQAGAIPKVQGWEAKRSLVWKAYLKVHPTSPKAEAAYFRLLRLKVREAIAYPRFRVFHFPEAPIAIGHKTISFEVDADELNAADLLKSIEAYRQQFPKGRYAADVDLLEASVHAAAQDPERSMPPLLRVLNDKRHVELRQDAAMVLSALLMPLFEGLERESILRALQSNPDAIGYLTMLAEGDTPLARAKPILHSLKP